MKKPKYRIKYLYQVSSEADPARWTFTGLMSLKSAQKLLAACKFHQAEMVVDDETTRCGNCDYYEDWHNWCAEIREPTRHNSHSCRHWRDADLTPTEK